MVEFHSPKDLTVANLQKVIYVTSRRFGYPLSDSDKADIVAGLWRRLMYPKVSFEAGGCRNYHVWVMTRVRSAVSTYFKVHKVNQLHALREVTKETLGVSEKTYRRFVDDHTNQAKTELTILYDLATSISDTHEKLTIDLLLRPCKERTRVVVSGVALGTYGSINQALKEEYKMCTKRAVEVKKEIIAELSVHGITPETIMYG
jgi:hypothetical protein